MSHKPKPKKLTKEEKKTREAYRLEVVLALEQLRRAPVSSSEKRFLLRKDFPRNQFQQSVIESLCDFVQAQSVGVVGVFHLDAERETPAARALWYALASFVAPASADGEDRRKKDKEDRFDPYASRSAQFPVDVRDVRNVQVAAEALALYLAESGSDVFPRQSYDAFILSFGSAVDDAAKTAALRQLLKGASADHIACVHRIVMLVNDALKNEKDEACTILGPRVLRSCEASDDQNVNTRDWRVNAFKHLCNHAADLLPAQYVGTAQRVGQSRPFTPEPLKENEWAILLEASETVAFKSGVVVIEANTPQEYVYRVAEGSFSVFVGETRVASLVRLDWFGETAFLGNHFSGARVVADKKGGKCQRVHYGKFEAVLQTRPDLAAKFYSLLSVECAGRLNVALLASNKQGKDVAVDPTSSGVPHVMRSALETRPQEKAESTFVYEAATHAVRVFPGDRIPKKASKKPRAGAIYVFPTRIISVYRRGHSEKKATIELADVKIVQEPSGSRVVLSYHEKKKDKQFTFQLADAATATSVVELVKLMQSAPVTSASIRGITTAVALFDLPNPKQPATELALAAGDVLSVLDQKGDWYYGFKASAPERKGLFPVIYVILRPPGAGLQGVMQSEDWSALDDVFVHHDLHKGESVLREGDAIHAGNLLFLAEGKLSLQRKLDNGLQDSVGRVFPGETLGELLFLLGGQSRTSVTVESDSAHVLQLPRTKLSELLKTDVHLASKFWKFMSCTLSSRLFALQARHFHHAPSCPPSLDMIIPPPQALLAQQLGSAPSLPQLPPPPLDAKEELINRIKNQGFMLGVDVPATQQEEK